MADGAVRDIDTDPADTWSYGEALAWLYGRQALGIKLGLEKVRRLLAALDDPQDTFESVHVAGTNGKGSVVRFLAEALRRSGHSTGCFTSPHLVRFTERINVDGEPISEAAVAAGLWRIRPIVANLDAAGAPPTFFEINTALAFLYFRDAGVQWAVVETGMGGRLDATNVLVPRLTVITSISLDHQESLGTSLAEIAYEKAGIMKPGIPCVAGADGDALVVLKGVSHDLRVPVSILGEDYHVLPDRDGLRLAHPGGEARYDVGPAGEHQLANAALSVAACDALRLQGVDIPHAALHGALAQTTMPGRLEAFHLPAHELAGARPLSGPASVQVPVPVPLPVGPPDAMVEVILDGAHNEAGAHALRWHLGRRDLSGFHLVAGFNRDKDWRAMLHAWVPLAAHVWGVPVRSSRSLDPDEMANEVTAASIPFTACRDASSALAAAAAAGARTVLVAGSLFLVGEAQAVLTGQPLEEVGGAQ